MKLFYAAPSPFVRKCLVAAHELGLRERIELVPASPHPVNRSAAIIAHNPLGKIPTLIDDDGTVLYDSRVICEYLNAQGDGHLIPAAGPTRWRALVEQSLGDGIMDAAVLARYETAARPESLRKPGLKSSGGNLEAALILLDEAARMYVKTAIPDTRPIEAFESERVSQARPVGPGSGLGA